MGKGTQRVAVVAVTSKSSRVWHLLDAVSESPRTLCGHTVSTSCDEFSNNVPPGGEVCKHCLRKLEASLGGRCQIVRIGD